MTASAEVNGPFVRELLGRSDYAIISQLIAPRAAACSTSAAATALLLGWLAENKNVDARGIEIDGARCSGHCPRRLRLPGRHRPGPDRLSRRRLRLCDSQPDAAGDAPPAAGSARDAAGEPARDRGVPQLRPLAASGWRTCSLAGPRRRSSSPTTGTTRRTSTSSPSTIFRTSSPGRAGKWRRGSAWRAATRSISSTMSSPRSRSFR